MKAAVGRSGGLAVGGGLALLLAAGPPVRLSAQLSLQPSLGLRYTSTMVHDSIVSPIDVRPALAPALALTLTTPVNSRWSAEGTVDVSWSGLRRHEAGATVDLGTLATLAVQLGVRRRLPAGWSGRVSVGGLKYFPSDERGIFRAGSGGVFAVAGGALAYAPQASFARAWGLALEARYDVHQFMTSGLRSQGFTTARTVHRVALGVATRWPRP